MSHDRGRPRMTAEEFVAWAMGLPDGERYELVGGEAVRVGREPASHARAKLRAAGALADAAGRAGPPCEAFADGMAVRVDDRTVLEPDALLRCGEPLPDDAVLVTDPVVVVEVVSRSGGSLDSGAKLADYFRLPSVRHYLIVRSDAPVAVHHARGEGDVIATRVVRSGRIEFDPPGLAIRVDELFG